MIDVEPTPTVGKGLPEGPTVSPPEFGEVLKQLRERAGLTQDRAAGAVGVSRPTFAQWEAGRHLPAEDRLVTLEELLHADGRLVAAAGRARGPQRLRPVESVEPSPGPARKPLLQVFADIRVALLDQLCYAEDGRPLGWRHNLVPSDALSRPLSTAYGLKTLAILGGLDPRTTALVSRMFDRARYEDGRLIGWRASSSSAPWLETTAAVFDALQRVGADLDVDQVVSVLQALVDDTARSRPFSLTIALDAILRIAPDSRLAGELVETLLACRVDFNGVLLWPEKRVERHQPLLQPSVVHTARAINALRHARGGESRDAVAIAEEWIAQTADLAGVSESIARYSSDGERADEVTFHNFTSAHVARALAGMAEPSARRINLALEHVWARYDQRMHLWAWGNGDVPAWMVMDAVSALSDCALALMPTPVHDSG